MKTSIIEKFNNISKEDANVCFLHTANKGRSILAKNPIDTFSGSSLDEFKKFAKKHKKHLLIGYLSYDLAYQLYDIRNEKKNDLNLPEIFFRAFKNWQEYSGKNISKVSTKLLKITNSHNFKPSNTKAQYIKSYKKVKRYIRKGEIYQVNLTHRMEAETDIHARHLFTRIINANPVDFLAYIEGNGFEILSASPERFIKIKKNSIEAYPIKGTRPRGKSGKEDKKLSQELLKSAKETAELNMITDLLRNDLNKVCRTGSVKVRKHRALQKCPTVWHTYSKITGKLAIPAIDALLSMLPGGSITGCPKKRAIEIIDELEPTQRGVYTGIIGYIKPNQTMDFNIAIRTIIKKGRKLYLQVGGGIVLDSNFKDEYQETLDKAKSFMNILY